MVEDDAGKTVDVDDRVDRAEQLAFARREVVDLHRALRRVVDVCDGGRRRGIHGLLHADGIGVHRPHAQPQPDLRIAGREGRP